MQACLQVKSGHAWQCKVRSSLDYSDNQENKVYFLRRVGPMLRIGSAPEQLIGLSLLVYCEGRLIRTESVAHVHIGNPTAVDFFATCTVNVDNLHSVPHHKCSVAHVTARK
jgi:hypothetical protein